MKYFRRRIFLILPWLLLVLGVGPIYADPWPSDGTPAGGTGQQSVLQTLLFALGEVDFTSLGVSDTELLAVGPQLNPLFAVGPQLNPLFAVGQQLNPLSSSDGGMIIVDDDGLDCPNFDYATIQAAVYAAMPGDKIKVCPGTYMEQVTIPAGKDGLTLFAEAAFQAVIKAPLFMTDPKAIVRVNGAQNVTIRHFTITGPGNGICNSIRYGVFVDGGGSALITDNHITEIHDIPVPPRVVVSGCQNGHGVAVGRTFAPDGPTTGSAIVVHNLIDKYQKGGVLVDNVGSSAEVAYNEVVGIGPTSDIAQNGIAVARAAQADVHHNKVSQNVYSPSDFDATGILLYCDPVVVACAGTGATGATGGSRVHHNDVFLNEVGIAPWFVAGTAEISYNNSRNNLSDGIHAYPPTSGNLIAHNKAFQNGKLDCVDDTYPTQNNWLKDIGRTENQDGLCKQAGPM